MAARTGAAPRATRRLRRRRRWLSPAIQLGVAVLVCVVLPFALESAVLPHGWHEPEAQHAADAALVALALGFWLHRSFGELPGLRESSGILSGHLLSFGATLTAILLLRISYSRALLVAGFVLAVGWFLVVYVVTQRNARLVLGIVPGGGSGVFAGMDGIHALPISLDRWPAEVDAVAADLRSDHGADWQARLTDLVLAGVPVYHSKDLYESLTGRADLEHLSENTFGSLGPRSSLLLAKLVADRLVAIPMLLVLSPLFLAVAVAVRLDTPGPALFRQRRIGFGGRAFTVFKFRTMTHGAPAPAERPSAPLDRQGVARFITVPGDARITRVGAFLRRCRLDELPQIINIALGQMSWIGPRPEAAPLSRWYQETIPFYRYRYVVRPGISGWAQVNQGHVAELEDVRTKLQYDFYYIRNFSTWLDLLIVAKTLRTMLTGFGHR